MVARVMRDPDDVWAPHFGCWNQCEPKPGCTLLGLYVDPEGGQSVTFCNAFYYSGDEAVDPDEDEYDDIRWFAIVDGAEREVAPPFAWAEARWVVPLGGAWRKAHGLEATDEG